VKIIRKDPASPMNTSGTPTPADARQSATEHPRLPAIEVTVQSMDASTMRAAVEALQAATERMQTPAPQAQTGAQQKPTSFTVTVTKRDAKGRAAEFDVRVKEVAPQEEPDSFTSGFDSIREAKEP
jgi:hypothetical protein